MNCQRKHGRAYEQLLQANQLNMTSNIDMQINDDIRMANCFNCNKIIEKTANGAMRRDERIRMENKNIRTSYNLHYREKPLEQSKEIKQNWARRNKFDTCFCVVFACQYHSFILGRDNRHQDLSPPNFEIFLIFPSFLRS